MLTFLGIGPGDPELITRKAARLLREADVIALSDTGTAERIIQEFIAGKRLVRLQLPMRGTRTDWQAAHAKAADTLLELAQSCASVVYPVLGDPSIYASSAYLMDVMAPRHPCRVVPGVPAMCALAAAVRQPLCAQHESLTVLDHFDAGDILPAGNTVIMKCAKSLAAIQAQAAGRAGWAAVNLGMEGERLMRLNEAGDMQESYFCTALIRGTTEAEP